MQTQFETAFATWQSIYAASELAEGTNAEAAAYEAENKALNEMLSTPSATGADLAQKFRVFVQREISSWGDADRYVKILIAEASQASFAGRTN